MLCDHWRVHKRLGFELYADTRACLFEPVAQIGAIFVVITTKFNQNLPTHTDEARTILIVAGLKITSEYGACYIRTAIDLCFQKCIIN